MTTIEERARKAVSLMKIPFFSQPYEDLENSYIIGANEQRKIDIDKACEWIKKYGAFYVKNDAFYFRDCITDFRKAMEE